MFTIKNRKTGTGAALPCGCFAVIWGFCALLSLSLLGAVIWVAWHFISKYW